MEFSARRRGKIHEGVRPFLPASMDCAPRELERPFARPFRLSGHIVREPGQMYQPGICRYALGHTFCVRVDGASPRRLWPPDGGRLCPHRGRQP